MRRGMRNMGLALMGLLLGATANAQKILVGETEPFSPYIFGHNLEHTRSAVTGGLCAQMLRNRKFVGTSRKQGTSPEWVPLGKRVLHRAVGCEDFYPSGESLIAYTRHIGLPKMVRSGERGSQMIQNLVEGERAGIMQRELPIQGGRTYELRTVTRTNKLVNLLVELTDRRGETVYASHTISLTPGEEWQTNSFQLIPKATDEDACIRYSFTQQAELYIGAVSMMPEDNFHGMRRDVVESLRRMGPSLLRWPGGNFAGEYRWLDMLLPVDERAPLRAYTGSQIHSGGFDAHEIDTDDFIALCREVGAEPMVTINLAWESPTESAQWVEYCNGSADTKYGRLRAERGHPESYNVRFWSLGNEIGYTGIEGPKGAEGYAQKAIQHADSMLAVSADLQLFASGPYPNDGWAMNSALPMADKVKYVSLHEYELPNGGLHYTTESDTRTTYERLVEKVNANYGVLKAMRHCLDGTGRKLHISYDEWNQWHAWFRPSCVADGIYTARVIHLLLNHSNELDIPVSCYFQPLAEGCIQIDKFNSRLTANGQMFALMKAHQGGRICRISENDDFSTAASCRNDTLTITLINERYAEPRSFSFPLRGQLLDATLYSSPDVRPCSYFNASELSVEKEKKNLRATLPPHSVALIRIKIKGK